MKTEHIYINNGILVVFYIKIAGRHIFRRSIKAPNNIKITKQQLSYFSLG